jgi:hypothetical protein
MTQSGIPQDKTRRYARFRREVLMIIIENMFTVDFER